MFVMDFHGTFNGFICIFGGAMVNISRIDVRT
jgi:hypothetical protein